MRWHWQSSVGVKILVGSVAASVITYYFFESLFIQNRLGLGMVLATCATATTYGLYRILEERKDR